MIPLELEPLLGSLFVRCDPFFFLYDVGSV